MTRGVGREGLGDGVLSEPKVYTTRGVLDFESYLNLSRALGSEMPLFFLRFILFAPKHRAPEHVGKRKKGRN